jgi:tetratricopeptide (TPR) repeat protein
VFWGKDPTDYRNLQDSKACSLALAGLKTGDLYSAAVSAWNEHGESDYREGPYFVNDYDPSQAPRYISLGADFMERGLHVEAHAYFSSAVRLTPDDPAAYKGRAGLYTKINRPDLAQADLQTAERLLNKTTASDGKAKPWEAAAGR